MSQRTDDKDDSKTTSWPKCIGGTSLVLTLKAVGFIWLVNRMDE